MTSPRYTPLRDRHESLGASFTDFGGWAMPVRYSSELAEHRAVRTAAGLFDISHMAEFFVSGPGAGEYLDYVLAGRLSTLPVGRAKYSLLLSERGGIVDDLIVYRLEEESFLVIANAGNRDAVAAALAAAAVGRGVTVVDATDDHCLIAVQGPAARAVLDATVGLAQSASPLDELTYYAATWASFEGQPVLIARTGYTGEDGYELLIPNGSAAALWDAVLSAGAPFGLVPAGLAARDTLRLEAGMPLYGHELSPDIVPAQVGLARVVAIDKDDFVGRTGLAAVVAADAPVLVGLAAEGKRAGRAGYAVLDAAGTAVGEVTSGALSPTLGHPIAMALVSPAHSSAGTELFIDVRGTRVPATVTPLPFYRRTA
ncbi:glycine cleavage system aminomethyltransferase GcvT [Microbacterium sp. zg.B48]|uniref:glycine cleavage system aminomethyltransferase GcvT n=1 Tax=Microbacterium sp. zg.B48 TaxID=2969408 RepID=UPI00214AA94E|nr:glycine cleavage system aminomethyltransferase GcvT [Microbacterium sp. zg.B48]MCR2762245.1 glycine cleavage system aminomethyltransferase GcvT [Microbacterium sp. zg.B48]